MSCAQTFNAGAVTVLVGKDTKQTGCITTVAGAGLAGDYFVMHEPVSGAKTAFWMDDGVASAPTITGATVTAISITLADTAVEIATKVAAALNLKSWIGTATSTDNHVSYDFTAYGYAYEARDGEGLLATGFVMNVSKFGATQVDVGALDGTVSITIEPRTKEIMDARYGNSVADELILGWNVSATWTMKDSSLANLQKYLGLIGGIYVPDDGSGAKLAGLGTKFIGKSKLAYATQVVFRPTKNVALSDASEDKFIPQAALDLSGFEFDPESEQLVPVSAKGYFDTSANPFVNFMGLGDASKAY
jgi:hypothetical protein